MKYILNICIILIFSLILISCRNDATNSISTSEHLKNKELFVAEGFKYKIIKIENEKFIAYRSANGYWEITQIINTNELSNSTKKNYENNNSNY